MGTPVVLGVAASATPKPLYNLKNLKRYTVYYAALYYN